MLIVDFDLVTDYMLYVIRDTYPVKSKNLKSLINMHNHEALMSCTVSSHITYHICISRQMSVQPAATTGCTARATKCLALDLTFLVIVIICQLCHCRDVIDSENGHMRSSYILGFCKHCLFDAVWLATCIQEATNITVSLCIDTQHLPILLCLAFSLIHDRLLARHISVLLLCCLCRRSTRFT